MICLPQRTPASDDLPIGLDVWLVDFIASARAENAFLEQNGAVEQAAARAYLIERLLERGRQWLDTSITVSEAAELLGVCPETIRRWQRASASPATRKSKKSRHQIRRGDALALQLRRRTPYNPTADAQDIAELRRR